MQFPFIRDFSDKLSLIIIFYLTFIYNLCIYGNISKNSKNLSFIEMFMREEEYFYSLLIISEYFQMNKNIKHEWLKNPPQDMSYFKSK